MQRPLSRGPVRFTRLAPDWQLRGSIRWWTCRRPKEIRPLDPGLGTMGSLEYVAALSAAVRPTPHSYSARYSRLAGLICVQNLKALDRNANHHIPCNYNSCLGPRRRELMSQQSKIDELERLLNSEEDTPIQILPNGEIREVGRATSADMGTKKPLTMKENLGGEY